MRKNIIRNLYKSNGHYEGFDWDYINTIPEMARLHQCEQNPMWHSEGNVFKHTQLACEKLRVDVYRGNIDELFSLNEDETLIIHTAVVLHDIGKGVTTTQGKDGKWHAYGHEIEGEKIARVLLWNEDITIRETVCALIRYHMEPLRIFESKNWIYRMYEIAARVPWKLLYYVKMADLLGSVQMNGGTMAEDLVKMDLIRTCAKSLNIWDSYDTDALKPVIKYGNNRNILPWKVSYNDEKIAYLMIGLPGSGKNTAINNLEIIPKNAVQLSRDDIRIELGYCGADEKYLGTQEEENKVTEIYDNRFNEAIKNGSNIILNNVHLKKKYRDASVSILRTNGYKIVYIYVEAPTLDSNYQRREGQIPADRIKAMALSFEWPETSEYDELIIQKQTY